jgi:hypothetical protein
MRINGLTAYYHSFTRIVADLGADSMSQQSLRLYFIAGLNPDAVRNTNLNLHMHNFLVSNPTATITALYAEAHKVISLTTNSNSNGILGKRAGPDRGEPRPQQWDRGHTQRPNPQHPQQLQGQPRAATYCTNCHHNGHFADRCTSSWTKEGKWIGRGTQNEGCPRL